MSRGAARVQVRMERPLKEKEEEKSGGREGSRYLLSRCRSNFIKNLKNLLLHKGQVIWLFNNFISSGGNVSFTDAQPIKKLKQYETLLIK